jgi:predicted patatin/cPLA2 family phospholipase
MSASLPFIFTPNFLDNKCFIDGGIFSNYPVNICLNETKCEKNEILGVRKKECYTYPNLTSDSSFMEYTFVLLKKILDNTDDHDKVETIPYDIEVDMGIFNNYDEWFDVFNISEKRKVLIHKGIDIAKEMHSSFLGLSSPRIEDTSTLDIEIESGEPEETTELYEDRDW